MTTRLFFFNLMVQWTDKNSKVENYSVHKDNTDNVDYISLISDNTLDRRQVGLTRYYTRAGLDM